MDKPSNLEICKSYALWVKWVDHSGTFTEQEFNEATTAEKLAVLHEIWPKV